MYLYIPIQYFLILKISIQDENYRYTIILSKKGLMQLVKMPSIQDF